MEAKHYTGMGKKLFALRSNGIGDCFGRTSLAQRGGEQLAEVVSGRASNISCVTSAAPSFGPVAVTSVALRSLNVSTAPPESGAGNTRPERGATANDYLQFVHRRAVLVETADGAWRMAVNVRSDDEFNPLFHIETDFQHSILDAIDRLPVALTPPPRGDHTVRTGYKSGNLFDTSAMRAVAPSAIGDPNELGDRLSEVLERAIRTERAEVFAFGNPWGPERKRDQYFHFTPGRGVHDLHMYQGSPPPHDRDDGVWQDGGVIVRFPGAPTVALFFAFQTQTFDTDDATGKPQ